jgi:hypothetical protein
MRSLTGSHGNGTAVSTKCCVKSLADSVTVQNSLGLLTHPICTAAGITRRIGLPASCGSTYAKLSAQPGAKIRC